MNIEIETLTIEYFQLIKKKQVVDFRQFNKGSFYYVTGKNEVEPNLGANNIGKSTIFNALTWCFYGQTSHGLKSNDIKTWKVKKTAKVTLIFKIDNNSYDLIRTQSPNMLTLNSKTVIQEELDIVLGLSINSFLYSVYVSQFSQQFFDLKPEPKLKVFTELLQLDKWVKKSDSAKLKANITEKEIVQINQHSARKQGQLDSLKEKDFEDNIKQWEEENKNKKSVIIKEIEEFKKTIKKLDFQLDQIEKKVQPLYEKEESLMGEKTKFQKIFKDLQKDKSEKRDKLSDVDINHNYLKKELKKFNEVVEKCPYCQQKVSVNHLNKCKKELTDKIKENRKDFVKLNKITLQILKDYEKEETVSDKINKQFIVVTEKLDEFKEEFEQIDLDKCGLVTSVQSEEEVVLNLKKEVNPYKALQEENKSKIKAVTEVLDVFKNGLDKKKGLYNLYSYWIKAFKEIRLEIVEEALQEFQLHINNNLQLFSLDSWEVLLNVQKENKSGTIRKGFDVFVKSPENSESVTFKAWGGGVGQRLRLSGTLGLMDLIKSRTGVNYDIEIWDEPMQHLSHEGIMDTLELLTERSKSTGVKLFLIDHRDLDSFGGFDGNIKLTKTKEGSIINQ